MPAPSSALIAFTQQLSVLLKNGVPLVQSLEALARQTHVPAFAVTVEGLVKTVSRGGSLSEAVAAYPATFSRLYASLIRVGESTGDLTGALDRLGEWLENEQSTVRKIRRALTYPVMVLALAGVLTALLFTTVVPQFMEIFQGLNVRLPWPTRILIWITTLARNPGIWVLALAASWGTRMGLLRLAARPAGRLALYRALLAFPALGPLFWFADLGRFASTLRMAQDSGLDLIQSLRLAGESSNSPVLEHDLPKLLEAVQSGLLVSDHLGRSPGVYHPVLTHLTAAGEETADLSSMLLRASNYFQEEVDDRIDSLAKLLEPVLLTTVGLLVGFVILGVFLPMYSYLGALQV